MCGISGIIGAKSNKINLKNLVDQNSIIRHRGPDDEGYVLIDKHRNIITAGGKDTPKEVWETNTPYKPIIEINMLDNANYILAFGHRRLSILDLSPFGHCPMAYNNGRYWITYNGEVYNYLELKTELEEKGHNFISNTDTEVILASYAEWGEKCLEKFNGMWAFAIYDSITHEVFISRDRFGIKPLYYWFSPFGDFCFGSEIKQFTQHSDWKAQLNGQRAYDYLVYSFTDHTKETMFKGVFVIPPGHYFKSNIEHIHADQQETIATIPWYKLKQKQNERNIEEAGEDFKQYFKSSVNLHLRADVLVGSALSGGLDSSAIVCEVNNLLLTQGKHEIQKTFSSCATDERFNEKKWVDIVIKHTQVDAHFVYPELKDVFKLTPEIIWYQDEPYQSQATFLGFHVFQKARQNNVKVLMNGQGADEYLGGYGQYTVARYASLLKKGKVVEFLKDINKSKPNTPIKIFLRVLYHLFPDTLKRKFARKLGNYTQILNLFDLNKLNAKHIHPNDLIKIKQKKVKDITLYQLFHSPLPKYLRLEDRNSMAHSVEARVPFLDFRLVEYCYGLPDHYLDYQGVTKRIMRLGLKDILPEKIANRKDKKGFITPEEKWVKEEQPELFRQKIKEAIEVSKGIIKPEALIYFDKVILGKIPFDYTYWRIILFAEWIKRFEVEIN